MFSVFWAPTYARFWAPDFSRRRADDTLRPETFKPSSLAQMTLHQPLARMSGMHGEAKCGKAKCGSSSLSRPPRTKAAEALQDVAWPRVRKRAHSMMLRWARGGENRPHVPAITSGHYVRRARSLFRQGLPSHTLHMRVPHTGSRARMGLPHPHRHSETLQPTNAVKTAFGRPHEGIPAAAVDPFLAQAIRIRQASLAERYPTG